MRHLLERGARDAMAFGTIVFVVADLVVADVLSITRNHDCLCPQEEGLDVTCKQQ